MPKKRFNIWMDTALIRQIKAEAKTTGLNKVSTYCRMACLEKMRRDQSERTTTTTKRDPSRTDQELLQMQASPSNR